MTKIEESEQSPDYEWKDGIEVVLLQIQINEDDRYSIKDRLLEELNYWEQVHYSFEYNEPEDDTITIPEIKFIYKLYLCIFSKRMLADKRVKELLLEYLI